MFRQSPSHAAVSPSTPRHTPDLLFKFHAGGEIWSSPAIAPDSTIYFGNTDGYVFAVDGHTGQQKWKFQTFAPVWAGPAVAADGTVYATSVDHHLYALRDGNLLW
ncbi:MAG: PQQ-binding-like beta-propeller repeat protein, partial [Gemmatimonadales bacterium]